MGLPHRLLRLRCAIPLAVEVAQGLAVRQELIAEVNLPRHLGQGIVQLQLGLDGVRAIPGALWVGVVRQVVRHADVQAYPGALHRVRPPAGHRGVVHAPVADVPVDLGADVVDPPLLHPLAAVGVGGVVALIPAGGVGALGQAAPVRPHAGGADAVGQIGVDGVEPLPQLLHQLVHVVPPPVPQVGEPGAVLGVSIRVVKAAAGVEVVVQVDAVDVVIAGQLLRAPDDVRPHLRQAGVEVELPLVLHHPVRVELGRVVGGEGIKLRLAALGDAEGVEPGVELQPQGVGPLHPVLQRVEAVPGGSALGAGEIAAPGVVVRGVQGVGGGPHLEDHRVHAQLHALLEDGVGVPLQHRRVGGGLAGVVQPVHRGHPHRPELLAGGDRGRLGRGGC